MKMCKNHPLVYLLLSNDNIIHLCAFLTAKKIEERRLELRRQIRAAKTCRRLPPGPSTSLLPSVSGKGVAVMDLQMPTQSLSGASCNYGVYLYNVLLCIVEMLHMVFDLFSVGLN